jgi:hypothetical protein
MEKQINGWNEWSKYVLRELERLNLNDEKILDEISLLRSKVEVLNVRFEKLETKFDIKSGVFGFVGGVIPVVLAIVYIWLKNKV